MKNSSQDLIGDNVGDQKQLEGLFSEEVEFISLGDLLGKKLTIPVYQRPYEWREDLVSKLVGDLTEADLTEPYLVGSFITSITSNASEEETYDIIDGQQRLVTFLLILKFINENDTHKQIDDLLNENGLKFESTISKDNIKRNYDIIQRLAPKLDITNILDNIKFVWICSKDISDAFTFFDSQNTRGLALTTNDIIKSHHIDRTEKDAENDVGKYVNFWENISKKSDSRNDDNFVYFIEVLLYRTRKWLNAEVVNKFYTEQNIDFKIFDEFCTDIKDIRANCISFDNFKQIFAKISITQDFAGGKDFFTYVAKYHKINDEITKLKDVHSLINVLAFNGYYRLKTIYQAALVLYYDKFGTVMFEEAVRLLARIIFYIRIKEDTLNDKKIIEYCQYYIKIFQLIYNSTYPESIIQKLRLLCDKKYNIYELSKDKFTFYKNDNDKIAIKGANKVKENCVQSFLANDCEFQKIMTAYIKD